MERPAEWSRAACLHRLEYDGVIISPGVDSSAREMPPRASRATRLDTGFIINAAAFSAPSWPFWFRHDELCAPRHCGGSRSTWAEFALYLRIFVVSGCFARRDLLLCEKIAVSDDSSYGWESDYNKPKVETGFDWRVFFMSKSVNIAFFFF